MRIPCMLRLHKACLGGLIGIIIWRSGLSNRHDKRLKQLVRSLNSVRHEQAKKIDILCNDMVSAHGEFIKQLQILTFGVGFYESILGCRDMAALLECATESIAKCIRNANVAIFLLDTGGFELHMVDDDNPIDVDTNQIESYFTPDIVREISRRGRISRLDDLYEMGLDGNISVLNQLSVAGIPIGGYSSPAGFVLVYRNADNALTGEELRKVTAITDGLYNAIRSCRATVKSAGAK